MNERIDVIDELRRVNPVPNEQADDFTYLSAARLRGAMRDASDASVTRIDDAPSSRRPTWRGWPLGRAAAAAAVLVGGLVVLTRDDQRKASVDVTTSSVAEDSPPAPTPFAAAIEASGVLTSPSADEVDQATDSELYRDLEPVFARIQVSATGNYVMLRTCRTRASATCGTGWAYVTGTAGAVEVHGGLLGEAGQLDLHLLDDRYVVASERLPDAQAPAKAWLIDAASGRAGELSWRDEPTILNSPEQALLLCQESYITNCNVALGPETADGGWSLLPTDAGLPRVVDARDGTIRPLAMPDDAVASLPVAQHGTGRIWMGTDPAGRGFGLAYSDDGGAIWTDTALPEQLGTYTSEELATTPSNGDKLLEIAADGDRVAVAFSWQREAERGPLYVSDDAGRSWTAAWYEPGGTAYSNGVHLYVLADGRLVLMWSSDVFPVQLLASTGSDWAELEEVDVEFGAAESGRPQYFSFNRAGVALFPSYIEQCVATPCSGQFDDDFLPVLDTIDFSTDLTNWRTIESPDG